jgi:hypothetical protein
LYIYNFEYSISKCSHNNSTSIHIDIQEGVQEVDSCQIYYRLMSDIPLNYVLVKKAADLANANTGICKSLYMPTTNRGFDDFKSTCLEQMDLVDADLYFKDGKRFVFIDANSFKIFKTAKDKFLFIVNNKKKEKAILVQQQCDINLTLLRNYFNSIFSFFENSFNEKQLQWLHQQDFVKGKLTNSNLDRFISSYKLCKPDPSLFCIADDKNMTEEDINAFEISNNTPYIYFPKANIIRSTKKDGSLSNELFDHIQFKVNSARVR